MNKEKFIFRSNETDMLNENSFMACKLGILLTETIKNKILTKSSRVQEVISDGSFHSINYIICSSPSVCYGKENSGCTRYISDEYLFGRTEGYNIFGIVCGNDRNKADNIIRGYGYVVIISESNLRVYKNGCVEIRLILKKNNVVERISAHVV